MVDDNFNIYFNTLANEIGVDLKHLPLLFSALQVDTDRLFPLLEQAIFFKDFSTMHYYSDALKGIIGNMHLYDIYEIITIMDYATILQNPTFLYQETLLILKSQIELLIEKFYAFINEV